jgi:hypothetical protein
VALLNLTNFDDHPTEPTWMVFRFGDRDMGREFVEGLVAEGIPYESNEEGDGIRLIGVKQRYRDAAVRINYQVLGRHREPFIGDRTIRWVLIAFTLGLVLLAFLGALLN